MFSPKIREIKYTIPLNHPLESEAYIVEHEEAKWQIICLPGTPCRKDIFRRFLGLKQSAFDIIVLSRAGFGKKHTKPVLDFHEQVKAVLPFLERKRTIILGISYGGALALTAAMNYSDKIEGVITGAALVTEPYDYARILADLGRFEQLHRFAPKHLRVTSAEIRGRRTQIDAVLSRVKDLNKPAEVLHGNLDALVSKNDAIKLANAIGKNANFVEVKGGTHYLELQTPKQLLDAALRLVDRIEKDNEASPN